MMDEKNPPCVRVRVRVHVSEGRFGAGPIKPRQLFRRSR